jgi:hypothetical protein
MIVALIFKLRSVVERDAEKLGNRVARIGEEGESVNV